MLTYALDEYGDFEGLKNTNEPIYIGGLIYDDHSVNGEEKLERKRVKAYYEYETQSINEFTGKVRTSFLTLSCFSLFYRHSV